MKLASPRAAFWACLGLFGLLGSVGLAWVCLACLGLLGWVGLMLAASFSDGRVLHLAGHVLDPGDSWERPW